MTSPQDSNLTPDNTNDFSVWLTNHSDSEEYKKLLDWLRNNPDYINLVLQSKSEFKEPSPTPQWKKPLLWGREVLVAKREDFHGTSLVTPELKKHSQLTAGTVTIAGFLNFISNQPLLFFAFKDMGFGIGPLASVCFNIILLKFTNYCGTAVSSSKKGRRSWSRLAFGGLIVLNTVQSLVAGVGIELMLNQPTIREERATSLLKEEFENEENRITQLGTPTGDFYETAVEECQDLEQELEELPEGSRRYNQFYVRAYGRYEVDDWSDVETANLPYCERKDRLEEEAAEEQAEAREELTAIQQRQGQITDLQLLEEAYPSIYEQRYTEEGELASGTDAVNTATSYFLSNLANMNLDQISFSLFFMLISIITSFFACFLSFAHSRRQDTQMSFSDEVQQLRDKWLEYLRQQMQERHKRELEETQRRLRGESDDNRDNVD